MTTNSIVFFDIETIPRRDINVMEDHWRFKAELPERIPRVTDDLFMTPEEFVSQTLDVMKQQLAERCPSDSWLHDAVKVEESAKKPRKGAVDLFNSLLEEDRAFLDAIAEREKEAALCPEMLEIVSICFASMEAEPEVFVVGDELDTTEWSILTDFWSVVKSAKHIVSFNGMGFDMPAIITRSAMLGVQPTRRFSTKPWESDHLDLMKIRWPSGPSRGLKWLAKSYGIDVPSEEDGSKVLQLFREGRFNDLAKYNASDVLILREVYLKMKGYFV